MEFFFFFLDYNIKPADLIWTPRWRNGNKSDRMRRNEAARFLLFFNVRNGRLQVLMRFGKKKKEKKEFCGGDGAHHLVRLCRALQEKRKIGSAHR